MKRPMRQSDGYYHVDGGKYRNLVGSRKQVWANSAYKTEGNLTRKNLMMNRWGRIVSANKHKTAKAEMRLRKYGYTAKKGKFGAVAMKSVQKR
jgi:hypothetical protein